MRALPALVFLAAACAAGCGGSPPPVQRDPAATRGLWITRWDFRTAVDVDRCLQDAARLGATDVYFQVRGQADAFYRSELEPWGHELLVAPASGADTTATMLLTDPGFDPLEHALTVARRLGLRLHAWVNVYPLWRGLDPPAALDHAFWSHEDWRLHDERREAQPLNDHYVTINPANPEAQDHIVAVLRDICARYAVDGLHLDYVRFVSDRLAPERLWPGDPATLLRWRAAGGTGDPRQEPARTAYRQWLREEITGLVRRVSADCRAVRPGLEISAAVFRRPALARDTFLQDGVAWLDEGLVDRLLPMIYTRDAEAFTADLAAWKDAVPGDRLTPGVGVFMHESPADLVPQLAAGGGLAGWALFAYGSFFESVDPQQDPSPAAVARRAALRASFAAGLARPE